MERWREAFLWTWIIAKMGGSDGIWSDDARDELKRILGTDGNTDSMKIKRRERQTKDEAPKLIDRVGWRQPKQTWVAFSSFDGHVSSNPQKPANTCRFSLSKCLPDDFLTSTDSFSANEIFKHMAFVERECGDCLITALVSDSGDRGLHTILPNENVVYHPPMGAGEGVWDTTEPVLPMTKTWEEANFDLKAVIRTGSDVWGEEQVKAIKSGINLRKWCLKLLTRYHYAMGKSSLMYRSQY
jgi:3-O-alpha-D-mannopyranosyl-alpha-D-mannopyranose xylosylphosphotransferase